MSMPSTSSLAAAGLACMAVAAALPFAAQAQPTQPLTSRAPAAQPAAAPAASASVPAARPAASASVQAVPAAGAPVPVSASPARPVVRQVPAPAPAPARPDMAPRGSREVGEATRLLLAAQADGRRAGGELPMLGEAATRSWRRYMDSFSQPIPEWFDERVEDN